MNVAQLAQSYHEPVVLAPFNDVQGGLTYQARFPEGRVFTHWSYFRDYYDQTGYWPLILEYQESHTRYGTITYGMDMLEQFLLPASGLSEAEAPFPETSLQSVFGTYPDAEEIARLLADEQDRLMRVAGYTRDELHPWEPIDERDAHHDFYEQLIGTSLLLIPVTQPWDVPRVLGYGSYRMCPPPAINAAIFQHWYTHYGAELVTLTSFAGLRTAHPLPDRTAALRVAWEHQAYCPDLAAEPWEWYAARLLHGAPWIFPWH